MTSSSLRSFLRTSSVAVSTTRRPSLGSLCLIALFLLWLTPDLYPDSVTQVSTEQYSSGGPVYTITATYTYTFLPQPLSGYPYTAVSTYSISVSGGNLGDHVGIGVLGTQLTVYNNSPVYHSSQGPSYGPGYGSWNVVNMTGDTNGYYAFHTNISGYTLLNGGQPATTLQLGNLTGPGKLTSPGNLFGGAIPWQFMNTNGTVTLQAVQDGVVIGTYNVNPNNPTLSINSTSTDPISLQLALPGYQNDPNGGLVHTGNTSQEAYTIIPITQSNTTANSFIPGAGAISLNLDSTFLQSLPANNVSNSTANGFNSNVGLSAPVGFQPVWTNPSLANSSYNISTDPMSGSVYKQGVNNLESAIGNSTHVTDTILDTLVTNTANLSSGGNIDLTPVVNAVNGVNDTINTYASNASVFFSTADATSNASANLTAASMTSNISNTTSQLNAAFPTSNVTSTFNAIANSSIPAGSNSNLIFTTVLLGTTFTVDFDPADNTILAAIMPWLRAFLAFIAITLFVEWAMGDIRNALSSAFSAQQIHGNSALGGSGGQVTSIANAVAIAGALITAAVILGAVLIGMFGYLWPYLSTSPLAAAPALGMYFANFFLPVPVLLSIFCFRVLWNTASIPFLIAVAATKLWAIG